MLKILSSQRILEAYYLVSPWFEDEKVWSSFKKTKKGRSKDKRAGLKSYEILSSKCKRQSESFKFKAPILRL